MSQGVLDAQDSNRPRGLERLARRVVHARLRELACGRLTFVDADGIERFGDPKTELEATVAVRDPRFYSRVLLRGALGGAEAYMEGWWTCDDPTALVRVLAADAGAVAALQRGLARLASPALRLLHALRRNTRGGSRRNIAAHYDLGNEFFRLFLDPTLTYSCGFFESEGASLEAAQTAKYERICRKLQLRPDDHVLEIGGGWGGFAIHAARTRGCRVTTSTISREQLELARERVAEAGLADRVEVLFADYRELGGAYDKLVSIEMIEAVGHRHLDAYFRACSERLRDDGEMLLQAILVRDQDYAESLRSVDFVKRHIFPGGQLVSLGAISRSLARASDLRITHLEDITHHYGETLRRWHERMLENLDGIRELGLSERFLRMWEFYLCYCEGAFRERANSAAQILLEKPLVRRAAPEALA